MPLAKPERESSVAQGVEDTEPLVARLQFIAGNPPGAIVQDISSN